MRKVTFTTAACTLALQAALAGCAKDGDRSDAGGMDSGGRTAKSRTPATMPGQMQNEQNAQALLREAEAAEQRGEPQRAMEIYEDVLRDFPDGSRPKDLEQRVANLRKKMEAQPQGQ